VIEWNASIIERFKLLNIGMLFDVIAKHMSLRENKQEEHQQPIPLGIQFQKNSATSS